MVEKRLTGKSRPVTATFMRRSPAGSAALAVALLSCFCQPATAASDDKSHGADSLGHLLDVFNPYASLTVTNREKHAVAEKVELMSVVSYAGNTRGLKLLFGKPVPLQVP